MTDEDIIDCILDVDKTLSEVEASLENKKYKDALARLKEARAAIDELRQEDCTEDTDEVGSNVMNELK